MITDSLYNKFVLIDLDGTMYRGNDVIPSALLFVEHLQKAHIPFLFVTNNATRTHAQNREKMESLGFHDLEDSHFFTSAMAAASYIKNYCDVHRVFCIGEDGLKEALLEQDFLITETAAEAVVVGLDKQLTYDKLCSAYNHLQHGAILIGTNQDRRIPHGNQYLVGNGGIVSLLEYCSETCAIFTGKPTSIMMQEILRYTKTSAENVVMIGDNLETDVAFGLNNHVQTIFVTSGVHKRKDCQRFQIQPDLIIEDLMELV